MDNLAKNDFLQIRLVHGLCKCCGKESLEWQCQNGEKIYGAHSIEAAIKQVPLVPEADKTCLKISTSNACGEVAFMVSSNHPKNGDAGHGGVTSICVQPDGMDMSIDIDDGDLNEMQHFENCSFYFTVRGDEEFRALLNGLIGVVEALKRREDPVDLLKDMIIASREQIDEIPIDKEALRSVFENEEKVDD